MWSSLYGGVKNCCSRSYVSEYGRGQDNRGVSVEAGFSDDAPFTYFILMSCGVEQGLERGPAILVEGIAEPEKEDAVVNACAKTSPVKGEC